ncbi:MAG TPA: FHA domain-containing protein [Chloroflexi bacterium]|nr:FHA domain-containing protein [Chloroflexota bacterium]
MLAGLMLIVGAVSFWWLRRHHHPDAADELPTEIVVERGEEDAPAYLVALETSLRMPQCVPLYAGRETRLGRDRHFNTVALNDIGISRRHATIIGRGSDFYVRDEESRGGTFINHRRLHKDQEILLHHDDIIQFYTFTYQFVLSEAPTQVGESEVTLSTRLDTNQIP